MWFNSPVNTSQEQALRPLLDVLRKEGYDWSGTDSCLTLTKHLNENPEGPHVVVGLNSDKEGTYGVECFLRYGEEPRGATDGLSLEQTVGAVRALESVLEDVAECWD